MILIGGSVRRVGDLDRRELILSKRECERTYRSNRGMSSHVSGSSVELRLKRRRIWLIECMVVMITMRERNVENGREGDVQVIW